MSIIKISSPTIMPDIKSNQNWSTEPIIDMHGKKRSAD